MCNILHFRITLWYRTPIITPKCVIYYTFVLHFYSSRGHCREFVWHVHVLPMFTEREQEELVNSVLRMPNNIYLSAVPLVPDVPLVPKDVPDVPYVPHVPVSGQFVWHLPINMLGSDSGKFL